MNIEELIVKAKELVSLRNKCTKEWDEYMWDRTRKVDIDSNCIFNNSHQNNNNMKAPDKIWINPATDLPKLSGHIDKNSVEYIRKDAFIEKACDWLRNSTYDYLIEEWGDTDIDREELVKDFKKAMKGE